MYQTFTSQASRLYLQTIKYWFLRYKYIARGILLYDMCVANIWKNHLMHCRKWQNLCHIIRAILFRSLLRALVLNTKLKEAFCSVFYWWKKFSPFITLRICYIWRCIVSAKEGNDRTFLCDFDLLCKSLHLFRLKRLCFTLRISLFCETMISFHKISWF